MARSAWMVPLLALGVTACGPPLSVGTDGSDARGRYSGIGTYPADRLWRERRAEAQSNEETHARLADDSQIIVVVDTRSGEVRQCGNNSGQCIGTNPWTQGAKVPSLPAVLNKHAADVEAEAAGDATEAQVKKR